MTDHLTYHKRFSPAELDAQYNIRAGRPDFDKAILPAWAIASQSARDTLDCTLDIPYGPGEKQKLDVFHCGDVDAATLFFVHGGYWQRGDKSIYSFIATPFVNRGVNVVVCGYDLCPKVSITRIVEEAREAVEYLWRQAEQLLINRNRITVMGHSAGGHITQMMMATDWSTYSRGLPKNLIKSAVPISPISYLEPVRLTESLNSGILMDAREAELQSPMTHHPPVSDAPHLVVVGGAETDEFHRQARMYVETYRTPNRSMVFYKVPDVDHFDEINVLVDSKSVFFNMTYELLTDKALG